MSVPFYGLYGIERAGRLTRRALHRRPRLVPRRLPVPRRFAERRRLLGRTAAASTATRSSPPVRPALPRQGPHAGADDQAGLRAAPNSDDWNHKHNDMRNVVEFASKELFKKQPMAWQIFDVRDLEAGEPDAIHDLARAAAGIADRLLQRPRGASPATRTKTSSRSTWTTAASSSPRRAATSRGRFDPKFRKLMKRTLPRRRAEAAGPTPSDLSASGQVVSTPATSRCEGIERGCKTIVVYSPNAISGYWEANDTELREGQEGVHAGRQRHRLRHRPGAAAAEGRFEWRSSTTQKAPRSSAATSRWPSCSTAATGSRRPRPCTTS